MRPFDRIGQNLVVLAVLLAMPACSRDPESAKREHLARGDAYVAQNKLAEAVIEYRNAINLDGRYGEARYKLGDTYERLGDAPNAYREYIRAADLLPDRDEVQLKAGQYMLRARRFDDAKRIAQALLKKNPRSADAQVLRANAMAGLKDLPSAIAELESAILLDPKRVDTYLNLAAYQAVSGNAAEAEAVLRGAIEQEPGSVNARLGLASLYWASGDLAKAEALLREALALQPTHALANRTLAALLVRSGRTKEAEGPIRTLAESTKAPAERLNLAEYYLSTNRSGEALPILNALTSDKDSKVPASLLLARWEYGNGQKSQAHQRLDLLLAAEPANTRVLLLKAMLLSADGRVDEALSRAQAAAVAAPKLAAAQQAIGVLYLQKKDLQQALKSFTEALKLDPQSTASSLQLAKIQLALGRADLALPVAQDVAAKLPQSLDAQLTLVRALVARGETARAETEVGRLAAQAPGSAEVQGLVGTIAAEKKNIPAARAAFARAQELDKTSTAPLAGLVALDLTSGKPKDAQARIAERLATDPANPAVLELAGRAYMATGDAQKAEQAWRKLIEVQPDSMVAYAALGQIFYRQGRLDDARRELDRWVERQPNAIAAHTLIGIILQMQNRIPEAQKRYERTLEINPNAAVAANNLAWLYAEQNVNLDTALQLAQTAKSQLLDSPEVDDTLGWVYYKKGLSTLAISSFQQSVTRDPGNAGYLYHLGLAHLKNGDKVKARESLEKALKSKGDFKDAAEARKVLSSLG